MRQVTQHHAFSEDGAALRYPDENTLAMLTADEVYFTSHHHAQPLAGTRFVKNVVARSILHPGTALENCFKFLRLDPDTASSIRDDIRIGFHKSRSAGCAKKQFSD
jgi:hypothetical protein